SVDRFGSVDPYRLSRRVADDRLHIVGLYAAGQRLPVETRDIKLGWGDNSLAIELSTLNFTPGISRRFAYRLADLDSAWTVMPDGSNRIDLVNLPEGKHRLEIILEDNPHTVESLIVRVSPPWYRTHTAFGIYILLSLTLGAAIYIIVRRRHARRIEAVERQAALDKVGERIEFLSNISHDLKTPLSMIIGPLSNLREQQGADSEHSRAVEVAYSNALKLNELIHRTIELNHVEAMTDAMMVYSQLDVVTFCRSIFSSYGEAYPARHFEFLAPDEAVTITTDAVKLESVLNNLLSNAVKYSDENSPIVCRIEAGPSENHVLISVADRGIGIPEEERGLIFQRMFRSARSSARSEGTGLGLYLVKRYVELLGGTIKVERHTGQGSVFTVCMPTVPSGEGAVTPAATAPLLPQLKAATDDGSRQRILIVDDNNAIASFIAELLGEKFLTATAPDGRDALEMIPRFKPDLIIADEMMPNMSGLEMVRALKASDTPSASVPVILLTAKTDTDLESESVRLGVDMFMTKPFEAPLLKARVEQMLSSRDKVRRAARIESITEARPIEAESDHERLLARITEAVENHIADTQLGVGMLSEITGIQSKQLYRLLKRYVGVSPVDFIRQTRLRKAAMLLEQGRFTVSEVMYMVGFSSPGYFSKCFAAIYGCTPSQYKNKT
ncbi:MAG: response regulator, partial [Muribaculaceae bacterium]|nr:response regulator [Muribaculaceae bacterium]